MGHKAEIIFIKLSRKKDPEFLTEGTKDLISGSLAAGASTVGVYPLDTEATKRMVEMREKHKGTKFKDLFDKSQKTTSTLRNLGRKFYGGLGHKLLKTVPAGALSFGIYGGTKRLLDKID